MIGARRCARATLLVTTRIVCGRSSDLVGNLTDPLIRPAENRNKLPGHVYEITPTTRNVSYVTNKVADDMKIDE